MEILDHGVFRVTRDADFEISDEADDLLEAVEAELRRRRFGETVRVEIAPGMSEGLLEQMVSALSAEDEQVYEVDGLLDGTDLWQLWHLPGFTELRDPPWTPVTQPRLQGDEDEVNVMAEMREGDILVHHPYDSFSTSVERFVHQAVRDPDVLAIKLTIYRTSDDSPLVPALIRATEKGKQAVCLVELKARFDEQANIQWARALEQSGVHVVYGHPVAEDARQVRPRRAARGRRRAPLPPHRDRQLPPDDGAALHRRRPLHVRRAARRRRDRHVQLPDRVRAAEEVPQGPHRADAPARRDPAARSTQTIEAHERGEHARIALKMNSLVDRRCIRALYAASQAGVQVDLNVRGICCLVPGIEGVSDNIRVVSVVGRFLEHSRIYAFERGDERTILIGSADLMPRNLDTRVELLSPVEDPALKGELMDIIERSLADNTFAWELGTDGAWERRQPGDEPRSVHRELMIWHSARAAEGATAKA